MNKPTDVSLSQRKRTITDEIHKLIKERTDKILVLGELAYKRMRHANVDHHLFEQAHEDIFQMDQGIAALKHDMTDLLKQFEKSACECGNELGEQDQFCGECGEKVVQEEPLTNDNSKTCLTCKAMIPMDASFCTTCGHAVEEGA